MQIQDLAAAFLTHERVVRRIRPASAKTYRSLLDSFLDFVGKDCDCENAAAQIQAYLNKRGAELGDHAFAKTFQLLRALFEFGKVPTILAGAPAPMIHDHERIFLTESAVENLLDATKKSGRYHSHRDTAILACCYYALLRVGEALRLAPADVDFETGNLLVNGKGGRQRHVPICDRLGAILSHWIRHGLGPGSRFLFPSQAQGHNRRGQLDNCRIEKALRDHYAPAAGLNGVTPHTLRRSGADLLRRRGVDLAVIQRLLGHRSITTTMTYLGVCAEDLRAGVSAFDWPRANGASRFHRPWKMISYRHSLVNKTIRFEAPGY